MQLTSSMVSTRSVLRLLFSYQSVEMLPALDNFLSYGKDVFISRPDYVEKILDIYVTAMTSDQLGEGDRCNGCKLIESLMLNLRGHVDSVSTHAQLSNSQSHNFYAESPNHHLHCLQDLRASSGDSFSQASESRGSYQRSPLQSRRRSRDNAGARPCKAQTFLYALV